MISATSYIDYILNSHVLELARKLTLDAAFAKSRGELLRREFPEFPKSIELAGDRNDISIVRIGLGSVAAVGGEGEAAKCVVVGVELSLGRVGRWGQTRRV